MTISDGTLLGVYGCCVGGDILGPGDCTVEMPVARHNRRAYRFAVSAASEARRGTDPVQAGLYNHVCQGCAASGSSVAHCPACSSNLAAGCVVARS